MKHFKTRRGSYKRELKKFGDLITFDAVDTSKVHDDVLILEKEVLVVRDCFTGIIGAYPSDRMSKDDVVRAVKQFIDAKKVRQAYSDHAPQFIEAMNEMKIPIDHSLPGRPQTNSIAERTNQFILTATSTCLLEAGLPPCFWRTAILCVCHLLNVEPNDDELSAWCKLHGSDFAGKLIPYGARVNYKPPKTREAGQLHKFGPDSIPGVFAGYHIGPGMHWSRQYKVWPLSEFVHQNLGDDASKPEHRLLKPHLTEKVEMVTPLTFPLKQEYERINTTLEGMKERELLDGDPSKEPHDDEGEGDDDELDDGDDDGGPGPSGGKAPKGSHEKPEDAVEDKDPEELTFEELIGIQPDHWKTGKAGDGKVYLNDDGEKVKLNKKGNPYKIGEDGRRLFKTSLRPKGIYTPEEWRKLSQSDRDTIIKAEKKKLEKKEADEKSKRKVEEVKKKALKKEKKDSAKDKGKSTSKDDDEKDDGGEQDEKATKREKSDAGVSEVPKNKISLPISCTSIDFDMYDIVDDDEVHGKRYIDCRKTRRSADASPCSDISTDVPDDEEYLLEWDEWSEIEKGHGPKAFWSGDVWDTTSGMISRSTPATPSDSTIIRNGKCVNVKNQKINTTDDDDDDGIIAFPTMPCTSATNNVHRAKLPQGGLGAKLFNAMVSRPVGRAEIDSNPKAKEAMLKEWKGLRDQEVFDFSMVREYDDVVAEAKRDKKEVHMARVHGICVEKNYQLPESDPGRKFKGRGVLLGNQVKNQHWEAAFFQDLGNSPASFEASRWADFYGCLPGHAVKLADAIQAYIQAKLKGPLCWVELPTDAWPPEIKYWKFRRPVVRLDKALYGHPDSGTMWEQHCDKKVQEIGFKPIGEEWPSMYFHDELKLLLVIYVDDLKLAGPSENLAKGWDMLRTVLRIEPETDLGLYLGCTLSQGDAQLHNGKKVKTITYNMEGLLKLSVEKYLDIIGKDTKLKKVSTPSLPEETKSSPYRAPADGKHRVECPWCAHSFDPGEPALYETGDSRHGRDSEPLNRGSLAPHAASVLMKLLYAARIARFDLLRSINALARNVTKWTKDDDARLHHLMCYVNSTLSLKMIGWVGDKIEDLSLGLFADADFAGCAQSLRSTSGSHLQVQGKFTRFPLAGGSKRQGCVSHSTPEAEIVAADTALRTLGIPALSLWKVLAKVFPQLLFHDDNQGMIGVVRSGRNPTMRHLERTHGISIASMHEHFQKDHFVLIYEITAKMAADIHTKGFKNPMAWKKACMLINLLEPHDLRSKEVLEMLQPSTDVDMTTRQVFQSKTDDIPNFPYTETPILPKEVYRKGLTSKEKLQHLPGMDPIFVVKQPVFYRPRPPGLMVPPDVLRSTWILLNGTWTMVEDRASPPEQAVRFDKWVERACFQYHSPNKQPLIPDNVSQSGMMASTLRVMTSKHDSTQPAHSSSLRDSSVTTRNRCAHSSSQREACVSARNRRVEHPADSPMLMFSVDALFLDAQTSPSQHPKPIHQCLQPATRVINTLMRLVHGGSEGWPTETEKQHQKQNYANSACQKLTEINDKIPDVSSTRKSQGLSKQNEDYWKWEGEETLIRIHKTPRRQNFVPQDCEDCPCDPRIVCDERETEQKFKTNTRVIKDTWRLKGDNWETTNKSNEFWVGKSTFKVIANAEVIDSDKSYKVSPGVVTLCTFINGLNTIPITDVFVPYQYHIEVGRHEVDDPKVSIILWREHKNRTLEFQVAKSPCDMMTSKFAKFPITINLIEVPRDVPCFVLLCSEERNWFTFLQNKMQEEMKFHVVPITEDDDMLSPYGISKARRCLRTRLDSVFFAGPCTGGSPWNRINRWVSEATTQLIEAKKQLFWAMWEVFTSLLCELINLGSPALLELPGGCDYWKDRRMTDLVDGTISHQHKFDGCMYGLKSQFQETPKPIKKPWKIVTWGVSFPKLRRKCDHRHEHAECAGRETRATQVYTRWIAKIIMRGINEHVIRNSPFVNIKVKKQWKTLAVDDQWKLDMSRDSENVRSHHIKSVTKTACAIREFDAADLLPERSLLHWYFSRSTPSSSRCDWFLTFLWRLHSGFNKDFRYRGLRPESQLELFESLSLCHFGRRLELTADTMADGNELRTLGQFSPKRIAIALKVLKDLNAGNIAAQPPPSFKDSRYSGSQALAREEDPGRWIQFGMPPVVVYSAQFANSRIHSEATGSALELAFKILQLSNHEDKDCTGWEFIARGARYVKVFTSKCSSAGVNVDRFMDSEILSRLDELWVVLTRGHFPEPFDDQRKATDTERKIAETKQRWRNATSFSTEPDTSSWLSVTRTAEYFEVMEELTMVFPRSSSDNDKFFEKMKTMVDTQMGLLGFSLRYHNKHHPDDKIILRDVMKDVINFETDQPKGRSAAQNYFLCLLALGTAIERHKTSARGDQNLAKVAAWSLIHEKVVNVFDIPVGVLMSCGYNVTIADAGSRFSEKERRYSCHSQLKDFVTTMTETQGGTGGDLHNFDRWDEPLMFDDYRQPPELDAWNGEVPQWALDEPSGGQGSASTTFSQSGPQPQSTTTSGETVQPKRMPKAPPESGASSSSRTTSTPGTDPWSRSYGRGDESRKDPDEQPSEDWIKRKRPNNVEQYIHSAPDYNGQDQRISFLRSTSNRAYIISTVEGPHSTNMYGANLGWRQYLRRLTFHAALTYNILTEGQLDSQMLKENDHEWLKLYHHIITTTELVRCKGYPITEVLAMLTLGVSDFVDGQIRGMIKQLRNQVGTYLVKEPWKGEWDQLGGQVRSNRSLILTDLTYETRSNSKATHNIETGLDSLGMSSVKAFQLAYEDLKDENSFLDTARQALRYLRENDLANVTVHIWISFAPLIKSQSRIYFPNDEYVKKLIEIVIEISENSPLPIFVNILKDARFLGSQSSIVSIAEEFARAMKNRGILHSTHERFWKQIYACGSEPFYWKTGGGKEVIWAVIEKSLMRQKVFLHCALDHKVIHELNEACVHVDSTGFDLETIKKCTDRPRIISNIRTCDIADVPSGSAEIIGGMKDMKDSGRRRAWDDIRRSLFYPEPIADYEEHWIEVKRDSTMMCDTCKSLHWSDQRFNTITENRANCLNCASNWTRAGAYGSDPGGPDEYTQDAWIAARLVNIYNECVDWREINAQDDLMKFLITATLAMLSGYQTSSDVLKQVSHRGSIRIPAYMVKGKCRGYLLSQYAVQREAYTIKGDDGMLYPRWFYRLLWDGGNVAYNDYMKTVLTKEEIQSILPENASAEYIGDVFEFWLGMLELAIEFPSMFKGWGPNIDQCLAGLEESFWLFGSSCRHSETVNTKRNRSKRAVIPQVEDKVVRKVLEESQVLALLLSKGVSRMKEIPADTNEEPDVEIEISSDEDVEMVEEEEPEGVPPSPTARRTREGQSSGDTEAEGDEIEVDHEEAEDMGGQPSEAKKRRTDVRHLRIQLEKMMSDASEVRYCLACGGEHNVEQCPEQDHEKLLDAILQMKFVMEAHSKSPSSSERSKTATRGRKDKLPKKGIMPHGKRWKKTRFIEKEEVTKTFYNQAASMAEIGDREEGGPFLVNDVEIHRRGEGVQSRHELDALVERAAEDSPPVLPTIQEQNAHNNKTPEEFQKWLDKMKEDQGQNYNFRYLQPFTYGSNIGTLEMTKLCGEEYVGNGWCNAKKYAIDAWMGRRNDNPRWLTELSKRFNATLRHSIGCKKDSKGYNGLPCDDAGWVNVTFLLQYDAIWRDGYRLYGTEKPDFDIIVERWNTFLQVIFTEHKQTKRIRAQVLGLAVTKGELAKAMRENARIENQIDRRAARIEQGDDDRKIWLWPVAVRAPMAHSHVQGGVRINDSKTSYLMNPGVGYTLGGGFHCTTFECILRIFQEGLRPGGGGDRINTFFVPFAPWDDRSRSILKYKKIEGADLVYIYLTYESLAKFSPRVSADGHILVQQTIPFSSFDAMWFRERDSGEYYRLLVPRGQDQLVLSVDGAKKMATVDRFDNLIKNVVPDETSPDVEELRKLIDIQTAHVSGHHNLFPKHPDWNNAVSLLALTHKSMKEDHRLCPACLCEIPANLSICVVCKGHLISHGFRKRVKVTIASVPTVELRSPEEDVKDHVKQAWEEIKIDLTGDNGEEAEHKTDDDEMEEIEMESPPEGSYHRAADVNADEGNEELTSEKRDYRQEDDVDKFLKEEREQAETHGEDMEMHDDDDENQGFRAGEVRHVHANYPKWMKRIDYGSKVLPIEACAIGDAQPELIKILLLQMGNNLLRIHRHYCLNFCENSIDTAWQHFQKNNAYRFDLDPKVPYLGEDENGDPKEPTEEQMRELYWNTCNPEDKNDLGPDGFTWAYYGSLVYKKLITYILECGFTHTDIQNELGEGIGGTLGMKDTAEEEKKKSEEARIKIDGQAYFVRRIIAGAYGVNAVYFFRKVDYQNSITLNPVDILCASRPQCRRIAVMHLIIQNGMQLPQALMEKLTDAIDAYNKSKKRDNQRPKWGTHLSEHHVAAIANFAADNAPQQGPKAKPMPKPSAKPSGQSYTATSSSGSGYIAPTPKQVPQPPPPNKGGKGKGKEEREVPPWREHEHRGRGRDAPSHRDWNWNQSRQNRDNRGWRG